TGPGGKVAPNELIGVTAPTLMGKASGGLAVRPVTKPVIGWSTWKAYPPRKIVLLLWNRSHAKPTRGWKFVLFCAYGSLTRLMMLLFPATGTRVKKRFNPS